MAATEEKIPLSGNPDYFSITEENTSNGIVGYIDLTSDCKQLLNTITALQARIEALEEANNDSWSLKAGYGITIEDDENTKTTFIKYNGQ